MKTKTNGTPALWTELLKDAAFPARCPVCGDVIPAVRRLRWHRMRENRGSQAPGGWKAYYDGLICRECINGFAYIREPYCARCGKQLAAGAAAGSLCRDCAARERRFERCRCVMSYDETARDLMAAVKYNAGREYIDILACLAADRLGGWIRAVSPDGLVPVPVHEKRLRERGYNQAALIAEAIGGLLGYPVFGDLLLRVRNTAAQKNLSAEERLSNMQNAFRCAGALSSRPTLLVIDDIYTTGATMESCAECLLEAGAARVYGLCICAGFGG